MRGPWPSQPLQPPRSPHAARTQPPRSLQMTPAAIAATDRAAEAMALWQAGRTALMRAAKTHEASGHRTCLVVDALKSRSVNLAVRLYALWSAASMLPHSGQWVASGSKIGDLLRMIVGFAETGLYTDESDLDGYAKLRDWLCRNVVLPVDTAAGRLELGTVFTATANGVVPPDDVIQQHTAEIGEGVGLIHILKVHGHFITPHDPNPDSDVYAKAGVSEYVSRLVMNLPDFATLAIAISGCEAGIAMTIYNAIEAITNGRDRDHADKTLTKPRLYFFSAGKPHVFATSAVFSITAF